MNTLENKWNLDEIDTLIYEKGIRIQGISFYRDIDLMLIVLNNKIVLKQQISDFKRLYNASDKQLNNYETDGIGIHWPELDEDLSLRGFIKAGIHKFFNQKIEQLIA